MSKIPPERYPALCHLLYLFQGDHNVILGQKYDITSFAVGDVVDIGIVGVESPEVVKSVELLVIGWELGAVILLLA